MFSQLTGALNYLSGVKGRVQIEGAFLSSDASALDLYQLISVPEPAISSTPLTIQKPDLTSTKVIGIGRVQLPLFRLSKSDMVEVNFYDRGVIHESLLAFRSRYATTGYAVLAPFHGHFLTELTPDCRVRLSEGIWNPSSHATTLTRYKIAENPSAGYMLAVQVNPNASGREIAYGAHDLVTIESNGKELRLELPPLPEERLMMWARKSVPVAAHGAVQELKGTGVTLVASMMAQVADAMLHNDWRGVQQTSVKSLALDGAAIFGAGAVSEVLGRVVLQKIPERILSTPTRILGLSGLKLGAASAFLQLLHSDRVSMGEMALNVGAGVAYQIAVGRLLGVLDSLGMKSAVRFFVKTPGTLLLSATFMFGMQQLHRQTVADELAPTLNQARSAVVELLHAEAKIREAQRSGISVEPEAIATVRRMMRDYIQQLKKLPDVDEVMLHGEHLQALAAIRESAQEASVAAMATLDPTTVMSQIDHTEALETQCENRKFAARLASLHEKINRSGRVLPSLEDATEFLSEPRYADMDNGDEPSQPIGELLSHSFSGMSAQLEDYLKASI